MNKARPNGSI